MLCTPQIPNTLPPTPQNSSGCLLHLIPFLSVGSRSESSASLPTWKRKASVVPALVPRHLEVMLFASLRHGRKLKDLSAAEFLTAAEQLFEAILDAFRRRVLHRDVSINIILLADNQLLLVDWELGGRFEELSAAVVRGITGTLDTMSVASLRNYDPLPHDDIESVV
ncbi:hypothetical protein B0H14DRAFT_958834 [Mycena olivaceomarginata]|nr:hypothetical protein B0H14DRAFT_958834 [Mycena olivaceomarginata]